MVELGVWRCDTYDLLVEKYGADRCIGYDIYNYSGRSNIIIKDVRKMDKTDNVPIALGRNHASSWDVSFNSRFEGLQFLIKNLVVGGYLIEANLNNIPRNVTLTGFSTEIAFENVLVLKKVSTNARCNLS